MTNAISAMKSRRPSRQLGNSGAPRCERSTLNAGRGAGSGYWLVSIGWIVAVKAARRDRRHGELVPGALLGGSHVQQTQRPRLGELHQRRRQVAGERRAADLVVDDVELVTLGRQPKHRLRKAGAAGPNSHEERTVVCACGAPDATACSPASFVRPYADSGPVGSDSRYGVRLDPSNT